MGASNWGGSANVTQKCNFYTQQSTMREDDDRVSIRRMRTMMKAGGDNDNEDSDDRNN